MVRDARPEDVADLARVHVASWQEAYRGLIDQAFLDSMDPVARIENWRRILSQPRGRVLVGEIDGQVEGFCTVGPAIDPGWGEVYSLYLDPMHWGIGLGRDLLAAGERALAGDGEVRALLWVLQTNTRARSFYERQGWEPSRPIRIENIGGVDVTEVRYEKALGPFSPVPGRPESSP